MKKKTKQTYKIWPYIPQEQKPKRDLFAEKAYALVAIASIAMGFSQLLTTNDTATKFIDVLLIIIGLWVYPSRQ